jgi:AmmeMemoRadiSam system protein A
MSGTDLGGALLATARDALDRAFDGSALAAPRFEVLEAHGATFVTLTQQGDLRGCVGTLEAHRPLREDVAENALAAAFRDPRFAPLAVEELDRTRIEVSLLSPPAPLPVAGERDLLARLRPGVDGVVLAWRGRRATFLPQVWEQLPDPQAFLAALKRKAGLASSFWDERIRIARYTVAKFREPVAAAQDVTASAARPPEGARPLHHGGGARSRAAASLGEVTQ